VPVPKTSDGTDLRLSNDQLREIHLALAVRIAQLSNTDVSKMGPNDKVKLQRRIDVCETAHAAVQKARGK
jgi:hypothetical protein